MTTLALLAQIHNLPILSSLSERSFMLILSVVSQLLLLPLLISLIFFIPVTVFTVSLLSPNPLTLSLVVMIILPALALTRFTIFISFRQSVTYIYPRFIFFLIPYIIIAIISIYSPFPSNENLLLSITLIILCMFLAFSELSWILRLLLMSFWSSRLYLNDFAYNSLRMSIYRLTSASLSQTIVAYQITFLLLLQLALDPHPAPHLLPQVLRRHQWRLQDMEFNFLIHPPPLPAPPPIPRTRSQ